MIISLAIAVNNVEDTRPVLDYYKAKGGGGHILETFKRYQEQLREEEEERNREIQAQRRSSVGKISPFSLLNKKNHSSQQTVSSTHCDAHCLLLFLYSLRFRQYRTLSLLGRQQLGKLL